MSSSSFQRIPISPAIISPACFALPQAANPCGCTNTALPSIRSTSEQFSPLFACRPRLLAGHHPVYMQDVRRWRLSCSRAMAAITRSDLRGSTLLLLRPDVQNLLTAPGTIHDVLRSKPFGVVHPRGACPSRWSHGAEVYLVNVSSRCIAAQIDDAEHRSSFDFRAAAARFAETPHVKLPTLNNFSLCRWMNFIESCRIWKVFNRLSVGWPEYSEWPRSPSVLARQRLTVDMLLVDGQVCMACSAACPNSFVRPESATPSS